MTTPTPPRRLAAILFTDIVGSTATTARSEQDGLSLRDAHRVLVRREVEKHHGRVVETTGDETLSVFESALQAVHAGFKLGGTTRHQAEGTESPLAV